ncbi:MAG: glutaredoxin family protein [Nitrospirae bacterium]|nr:glutaredoxin family protein [Nitrospirota bacterium]
MVRINFYYKDGCWLCDMAEEMLNGFKAQYEINVKKVDITSDENLYDLYRYDIPVFEFKDGSVLSGRIRKKDLMRKIGENRE